MFSTLRFSCIFYCHCIPFCCQVQPSPEEECISHPSVPDVSLCGVYKLSKDFYIDCSLARNLEGRLVLLAFKSPEREIQCFWPNSGNDFGKIEINYHNELSKFD